MMKFSTKEKCKYLASIFLSVLVGFGIYGVFGMEKSTFALMCRPNDYILRIIDDSVTSEVRDVQSVGDQHFKVFITSVIDHISSKFSEATP